MRNSLILTSVLSLSFAFAAGCRDDGNANNNTPDAAGGGGGEEADAAVSDSNTVYDVQNEATPVGTPVTLRSVVVTAIDTFGDRTGGMYVQETDGGEFSGVFVFVSETTSSTLAVGDLVDIEGGVKDEFAISTDMSGRKLTEISPPEGGIITITKVGTAALPTPPVVDPVVLSASDVEAEKWEGVPITFEGVQFLETTRRDDPPEISITGPYRVGGSLTQLDLDASVGTCYSSITGIGDYFFNYKILPRSADDIVVDASGASCAPVVDTTVVEAQNGTVADGSIITLTDVVVTAISADGFSYWVQDATGPVAFNGLFVFRDDSEGALPANVVVGNVVSLKGVITEFQGKLTELTGSEIVTADGVTGDVATLAGISIDDLATLQDYEGVLVDIPGATIVEGADPTCTQFCKFTVATGADPLFFGDDIFRDLTITAGQCYSIQAVMHFSTFSDRIEALPLEGGMVLNGAGCPQ